MSKINLAGQLCISAFWGKKQTWNNIRTTHSTTFWTCKSRILAKKASHCGHALLKIYKCFHWYLLNGRRYHNNSKGSEFSVKSTLNTVIIVKISFQISKHCYKNQKTKILNIFGTDRDIAKIPTVLNSAPHRKLVLKILRKSENIFFSSSKGFKLNWFCPTTVKKFYITGDTYLTISYLSCVV